MIEKNHEGYMKYLAAERSLTEYMKHVSEYDTEQASKIEKLRDQLKRI